MRRLLLVILAVALVARLHAQGRPDFSGKWEVIDPSGMSAWGQSFTVIQTPSTLTVESGAVKTTYAFNGGETQQTFAPPQEIAEKDPTKALWMYREASASRAAWMGDRLVIVTHHLNRVNAPSRPSQFDSQITIRSALVREGPDRLVVERITIADPDFDVPAWVDLPISVKSTYRKAQ